jgi:hypothetical protein
MTATRQVFYDVIHGALQPAYSEEYDEPAANFRDVYAAFCAAHRAALGPQSSPLLNFLVWGCRNTDRDKVS